MAAERSAIPEQTKQRLDQMGAVDLVVGLVEQKAGDELAAIVEAVRQGLAGLSTSSRTVLLHNEGAAAPAAAGLPDALEDESLSVLTYSLPTLDPSIPPAQSISNAYRAIWEVSDKLGARACVVIASSVETLTPQWIYGLVQPILERGFDLVAPVHRSIGV